MHSMNITLTIAHVIGPVEEQKTLAILTGVA